MPQQFSNNARSVLQSTITDTATSLTIASGAADLFPTANVGSGSIPSTNNWFKATLQDVSGNVEIIYVRTRNSGSAVFNNVLRGQEGTTARAFIAGSVVGLRVTAADIQSVVGLPAQDSTFTGNNTFTQPITGNLVGNADTATKTVTANFTIEESGGKLLFKHGTTTIASMTSAGVFTALSTVTGGGTP
jgi:hypothetical protein